MSPKLLFFALLKIYLLIISKKILYTERQFEPEKLTVYSQYFYLRKYPQYAEKFAYDKKALFNYFNTTGISKGECASPAFDIQYYLEKNPQLKKKFGNNYNLAYLYFLSKGKYETDEFSPIFNAKYYFDNNRDLFDSFHGDRDLAMDHFVRFGMWEGRLSNPNFNLQAYKWSNEDVRKKIGDNNFEYYMDYYFSGKKRGRKATFDKK